MPSPDGARITTSRRIAASRDEIFKFLSDLENHWLLTGRFVDVELKQGKTEGAVNGGRVRVHGPLGVRRTATTEVGEVDPPRRMSGTAHVGNRTCALVSWSLEDSGGARTVVTLAAQLQNAGVLDRILLTAGGRAWLQRRFDVILENLGHRFEPRERHPATSGRTTRPDRASADAPCAPSR